MSVHVIPDTPDVRAQMSRGQEEGLEKLGLSAGSVAVWEDGYRAASSESDTFEWWYFDCQFDDGSTLVVTFSNKPHTEPDGPLRPTVLVIRQHTDGTRIHLEPAFEPSQFSASTEKCDVTIGANTVSGDLDRYTMHIEVDGLVADLTMVRQAPSWRPGAGATFLNREQTRYFAWVVPVPYGTVDAVITENGETTTLTGSGYHDHNWGNQLMSSFLDHWFWGRAHIEDYTVVYVQMITKGVFGLGQIAIPTFYLAKGDDLLTDDLLPLRLATKNEVDGPGDQTYPTVLEWTWEKGADTVSFTATNPVLIEALDMRPERHGLSRLLHAAEHPEYYDFNADMTLEVNIGEVHEVVTGKTLYEKMMFR